MKPGVPVKTPHGFGILLTKCQRGPAAWWVLCGTVGYIVKVDDIEVIE